MTAAPDKPFECRFCHATMRLEGVHAFEGEMYCFECAPPGAVVAQDLPDSEDERWRSRPLTTAEKVLRWLGKEFRKLLTTRIGGRDD